MLVVMSIQRLRICSAVKPGKVPYSSGLHGQSGSDVIQRCHMAQPLVFENVLKA